MYINLTPNQHKRISFNTTTMTSLGLTGPPPPFPPPFCARSALSVGLQTHVYKIKQVYLLHWKTL